MSIKNIIPWRIRHRVDLWMENKLRPTNPSLYKFLKFGRINLNTPGYWDEVWSTDTIDRNYSMLFKKILAEIPDGAKVADVGCGIGNLSRLMRDDRHAQVTCLDFSQWACDQLAKDGFDTIVTKLPKIPLPDNSYDIAVATEVLEHLDRPERTIREMVRIIKPGGTVMFSVPNDTLHPHEELEHQNAFTKDSVGKMIPGLSLDTSIIELNDGGHQFLFIHCTKKQR